MVRVSRHKEPNWRRERILTLVQIIKGRVGMDRREEHFWVE